VAGQIVGLGSGSTAEAVVLALAARQNTDPDFSISGVATSIRTADLARASGIVIRDLADVDAIDIGFDGADEIDPSLNLVKGKGGALLYEKLIAEICQDYVVVSTDEKLVARLGTRLPLPVEVIPYGWVHTSHRIARLGYTPTLRQNVEMPYRTDAGNFILDCVPDPDVDLLKTATTIKAITGVVEHGVFNGFARSAMIVDSSGAVRTITPQ
jgi:ribose 5-phosphate isomerase A